MTDEVHWFEEAKFGMFIHWGIYACRATGEWAQFREQIPFERYEGYMRRFKADRFDADEWVEQAVLAGMGYMVFTTKHHDGFCMFDSDHTDYKSTNTPADRDFVGELAGACRDGGIGFGTYFSLWDMHHPGLCDGPERKRPAKPAPEGVDYVHKQVEELMTRYGRIDMMWFDGGFGLDDTEAWRSHELIDKIRGWQPGILINDRLLRPCDVTTPENEIPEEGVTRDGEPVRWETCMCLNDNWGYTRSDTEYKPAKTVIRNLVEIAAKGGNLLLNVGPDARGAFPEPWYQDSFEEVGQWLDTNGESIYGTAPCGYPIDQHFRWRGNYWTRKGNTLYLHLLKYPYNGRMVLPIREDMPIEYMYLVCDGGEVDWEIAPHIINRAKPMVVLDLPPRCPDEIDTVVAVELKE